MSNIEIRQAMLLCNVKQWQVAEACGYSDSHFSKKLRTELGEEEKNKVLSIIEELKQGA